MRSTPPTLASAADPTGAAERSPAPAAAQRAAELVRALERLLAETQKTLAADAAEPASVVTRAGTLRRLKDETARLLAELAALLPPAARGRQAA